MNPSAIDKYGFKAASLLYLKEHGFFPKKLLVLDRLPSFQAFKDMLDQVGLANIPFGIRFSPHNPQLCIKSKHQITDCKIGYDFLKEYEHQGTAIIQEHTTPYMMGTLYFGKEAIIVNIVPGTWASSACDSCDVIEISDNIIYYKYTKNRHALYADEKGFEPRIVAPFSQIQIERLIEMFRKLLTKLSLVQKERMMIEFIVDEDYHFLAMELKESKAVIPYFKTNSLSNLFEINEMSDIVDWDKRSDLLISVKLGRSHPPGFFSMINEIKKHKDNVYIKYGLLSHPAILLREHGIKTEQYTNHYDKIVFPLQTFKNTKTIFQAKR